MKPGPARAALRPFGLPPGVALVGLAVALVAAAAVAWAVRGHSPPGPSRFSTTMEARSFLRGNVHTHSNVSDGDRPPDEVIGWYREHGYAFVALTDHDSRNEPVDGVDAGGRPFLVLPGEEISMKVLGTPVHVNALCHQRTIGSDEFPTVGAALRWAIREVRHQNGIALVNHPNFEWAIGASDLEHAAGAHMLEIWSGHPHVRSGGDLLHPSSEQLWDGVLAAGMDLAAVAVDDVHYLDASGDPTRAGPGRGWLEVWGAERSVASICAALGRGQFYASTGARLGSLWVRDAAMGVVVEDEGATVEFVGKRGQVLATERPPAGGEVVYRLRGGEAWVRARVTLANGARAWTQPSRVQ